MTVDRNIFFQFCVHFTFCKIVLNEGVYWNSWAQHTAVTPIQRLMVTGCLDGTVNKRRTLNLTRCGPWLRGLCVLKALLSNIPIFQLKENWKRRCSLSLVRMEEKRNKEKEERQEHEQNVERRTSIIAQQRCKSQGIEYSCQVILLLYSWKKTQEHFQ